MINKSLLSKIAFLLVATIVGCRFSRGYFMAVVVLSVLASALRGKNGWALLGYIMLPVVFFLNETIIGAGSLAPLIARLGIIALPFGFMIQGAKIRTCMRVPIGWMVLYLCCAAVSSINGWFPLISYFKILNFLLFIMGLKLGVQNMNGNFKELDIIRHGLITLGAFVILGSLASYPFPAIGYSMEIENARLWGAYGTDAEIGQDLLARGGMILFSGVLRHSQLLSPMATMFAVWVLCDMIFIVRRVSWIHAVILLLAPALLYLTKSRTGLFSLVVGMMLITFYALPRATLPPQLKTRMRGILLSGCVLMGAVAVFAEIRSHAITEWILKWNADAGNGAVSIESIAESRMGLIGNNMSDFYRNPMLGMGFQVLPDHRYLYNQGKISLLSAPIEKGVLPTMVLGEGGILGAIVFSLFLIGFYGFLVRRRYVATVTLFTTFMATNMGEASFFSPGGHGGLYWLISIAGGMSIDYLSKALNVNNRMEYLPA
jgi:hypothetical protein